MTCSPKLSEESFLYRSTAYHAPTCVESTNHSVVVYRTADLVRWEFPGEALPASARPDKAIEYRPHVVVNAKTQLFVMWYNIYAPDDEVRFRYAVAVSQTAQGPYRVTSINVAMRARGVKVGDFDILVDGSRAILVHGDGHMAVEELDPTFTRASGRVAYFDTPADKWNRGAEGPVSSGAAISTTSYQEQDAAAVWVAQI